MVIRQLLEKEPLTNGSHIKERMAGPFSYHAVPDMRYDKNQHKIFPSLHTLWFTITRMAVAGRCGEMLLLKKGENETIDILLMKQQESEKTIYFFFPTIIRKQKMN